MAKRSPVLGYNHNVRYRGLVFHVQTEDSGTSNPHVFTHCFNSGVIINTRKVVYDPDADDGVVKALMQAQHKAIMRELKNGVFDDKIDVYLADTEGLLPRGASDVDEAPAKPAAAEPAPVIPRAVTPGALAAAAGSASGAGGGANDGVPVGEFADHTEPVDLPDELFDRIQIRDSDMTTERKAIVGGPPPIPSKAKRLDTNTRDSIAPLPPPPLNSPNNGPTMPSVPRAASRPSSPPPVSVTRAGQADAPGAYAEVHAAAPGSAANIPTPVESRGEYSQRMRIVENLGPRRHSASMPAQMPGQMPGQMPAQRTPTPVETRAPQSHPVARPGSGSIPIPSPPRANSPSTPVPTLPIGPTPAAGPSLPRANTPPPATRPQEPSRRARNVTAPRMAPINDPRRQANVVVSRPAVIIGGPRPSVDASASAAHSTPPAAVPGANAPGKGRVRRAQEAGAGQDLISERSLDEVILAYLSEDGKE